MRRKFDGDFLEFSNQKFWEDVNKFKEAKDTKAMELQAHNIFHTYVKEGSQFQVNVDTNVVKELEVMINDGKVDVTMFDEAQQFVFELMRTGNFDRFVRTYAKKKLTKEPSKKELPSTAEPV